MAHSRGGIIVSALRGSKGGRSAVDGMMRRIGGDPKKAFGGSGTPAQSNMAHCKSCATKTKTAPPVIDRA